MQVNKTFYLFVKGQRVEVSDEIYHAYVKPEDYQRKREERAKEKVNIASIEQLSEKVFEIEDTSQDFVTDLIETEARSEEVEKLHAAIEQLSERDKQVVQLYYFEGKTQKEIATIFGISQQALQKLLMRILVRLKNNF